MEPKFSFQFARFKVNSSRMFKLTLDISGTTPCDVTVSDGNSAATASTQYDYQDGVAPTVTSIDPARGGTGGGTTVTIYGTGLT